MRVRTVDREDIPRLLQLYRHLDPDDKEITVREAQERWEQLRRYPGSNVIVDVQTTFLSQSVRSSILNHHTRQAHA